MDLSLDYLFSSMVYMSILCPHNSIMNVEVMLHILTSNNRFLFVEDCCGFPEFSFAPYGLYKCFTPVL